MSGLYGISGWARHVHVIDDVNCLHVVMTEYLFIIQLCFVEYKYRAKRVQISHDICTRLIPPGRVKFKTLASQNFGKRNRWIINLLLDVLVCSIAVYFYSLFVF